MVYSNGKSVEGHVFIGVDKITRVLFHRHFRVIEIEEGSNRENLRPFENEYGITDDDESDGNWDYINTKAIYALDLSTGSIEFNYKDTQHKLTIHRMSEKSTL
jgi:hypothetical protein